MIRRYEYFKRNVVPTLLYTLDEDISNQIESEQYYSSGGLSYRYIPEWAKLPEELWGHVISGIACDEEDCVYLTMRCKQAPIVKLDPEGNFLCALGQQLPIAKLHGISIGPSGSIWVTDDTNHVAFELDRNGRLLKQLGTLGRPSNSGYHPDYIAPDDTSQPIRVKVYDEYGAEVERIVSNSAYRSIERLAPPFNKPTKIIETQGHGLFASDGYGNTAIHAFDQDGNLLRSWGGPGREPGHFSIVHSLWIDSRRRIWACDREQDRVQVFSMDGELLRILDGLFAPSDVFSDQQNAYVLEADGRISIYDLDYRLVAQIGHWQCANLSAHSMTGDSKGNLLIADCGVKGVVKLERQR